MANRRTRRDTRDEKDNKRDAKYRKDKKGDSRGRHPSKTGANELLDATGRDNDPNWYFTDATMADQVSQLSFQNLAGYPINFGGKDWDVPNMVRVLLNPSPGVIKSTDYGIPQLDKTTGINLAGFKLFSKLSAYTGRIANYGPQDISVMILAFGEVISCIEWIRRVFGVANASSMRNRDYPRNMVEWSFGVDADDLYKNYANYRTRFNGIITMVNQLPIPRGITYFDKCAALYEKVYLDSPSSMAQTISFSPFTTWIIDEANNPKGTQLVTTQWCASNTLVDPLNTPRLMSDYLDTLDLMTGALLNSSSLQTVYTDLLNLAVKLGQEFWRFDFLIDGYLVVPEYNQNMLLQMHNATIPGAPSEPSEIKTPEHVTPMNDVVPNPVSNSLFYNPGFLCVGQATNGSPRTGRQVLIDMLTDTPTVVDRVECTRYSAISGYKHYVGASTRADHMCDAVLPDHYAAFVGFSVQNPARATLANRLQGNLQPDPVYTQYASYLSNIDWAPRIWKLENDYVTLSEEYVGDINFYTVIDEYYLRKLHQFMTLGLYDMRTGSKK